jgi:hypothetical protein
MTELAIVAILFCVVVVLSMCWKPLPTDPHEYVAPECGPRCCTHCLACGREHPEQAALRRFREEQEVDIP